MQTQRYKLTIAYRGTAYHGWQRQIAARTWKGPIPKPGHGIPTVQETLTRCMAGVVRHPVTLVGSSRTDSGVHAKGQVAHFDTPMLQIPMEGMRRAINHQLPDDIVVRSIEAVPRSFDAIASARRKRYQYVIWNALDRPTFFADLVWHRWQALEFDAMREAAEAFIGEQDFASFARPGHGRETTIRTIHACKVSRIGPRIVIGVEGSGFLWQMVRIIVGTLADVGLGVYPRNSIKEMIAARDRRAAGATTCPHGLYLQWVETYQDDAECPSPSPTA